MGQLAEEMVELYANNIELLEKMHYIASKLERLPSYEAEKVSNDAENLFREKYPNLIVRLTNIGLL